MGTINRNSKCTKNRAHVEPVLFRNSAGICAVNLGNLDIDNDLNLAGFVSKKIKSDYSVAKHVKDVLDLRKLNARPAGGLTREEREQLGELRRLVAAAAEATDETQSWKDWCTVNKIPL